jgi:hypothetical protein
MGRVLCFGTSQAMTPVYPDAQTLVEARSPLPAFKNLGRGVF